MTTITHQLSHLETNGLVKLAQTAPELEYLFRHALVLLGVLLQRCHSSARFIMTSADVTQHCVTSSR